MENRVEEVKREEEVKQEEVQQEEVKQEEVQQEEVFNHIENTTNSEINVEEHQEEVT